MNKIIIFTIASIITVLLPSCKKEGLPDPQKGQNLKSYFKSYNWAEDEKKFFSLDNHIPNQITHRSLEVVAYHPLLIRAYNEIADQNARYSFTRNILTKVGYPLWNQTFIYNNRSNHENFVAIPLVQNDTNIVSGLIVVTFRSNGTIINGITRQEVLQIGRGNTKSKLGYAKNMLKFEHNLFNGLSPDLEEACCELQQQYEENTGTQESVPCGWIEVDLCYDEYTNSSWTGGLHNLPPHLDHDLDGIPNESDQDWYDWSNRNNVTQAEFQAHIEQWWEDHYEQQFGDYDTFWQDPEGWFSANYNGGDWNQFWEDIGDFFDDLESDLGNIFDGIGHFFGDLWDDFWDHDHGPGCYDFGHGITGETHIGNRSIICNWYYINDCPSNFYPWWTFPDGFSDEAVFNDRLLNYWEAELKNKIDYLDLHDIAEGCDPWSQDFEACVEQKYYLARRAALSDIIDNNDITEFDLDALDYLTQNCNYSNDFEDCVSEIYTNQINWYYEDIDGGLDYQTQGATWDNHNPINPQTLPTLSAFNNGVPRTADNKHWLYGADNLYELVGGDVEQIRHNDVANGEPNPTSNTCSIRVSIALNASGVTIPHIFSDDNSDGIQDNGESDITVEGADGKYYFLRAEFLIEYCLAVFPQPDITVTREQIQNGATPISSFGENQGIYMMFPYSGSNWAASGHCDYLYKVPDKSIYHTTSGFQWNWVGTAYLWILE